MNQDYITYANKLNDIGNNIIDISNVFMNFRLNNVVESERLNKIKDEYHIFTKAIEDFKKSKLSLLEVNCPDIVKDEHNKMVNSLQKFIDGTETMFTAIDLNNCLINYNQLAEGMSIQSQGKNEILEITNRISAIFSKAI